MNTFVYRFATETARYLLLPAYTRITVVGKENVPLEGPLIIASNHLNDADPGIIATGIPRKVGFMAKAELFRFPVLSHFLRAYGAFPVRRNQADLSALRFAQEALDRGGAVCIFPEGTRAGPPEQLRRGWPGAALLALRNDLPVLPIAIAGSGRMGMPGLFLRFYRRERVTLTIGEPFRLERPQRLNTEAAAEATRQIMERIAALLPPENRGYYGYVGAPEESGGAAGEE